jgi:hypothetical protein
VPDFYSATTVKKTGSLSTDFLTVEKAAPVYYLDLIRALDEPLRA